MKPPCKLLDNMKRFHTHILEKRKKVRGYWKITCKTIRISKIIRAVHGKKSYHQSEFYNQNPVGISFWPPEQFFHSQSLHPIEISSDEKYHNSHYYQ